MPKPLKPKAFDLKLTDVERDQLTDDLCREIDNAFSARALVIADGGLIDLADWFYEQGRSDPADRPFPGAADLTSYFITENVDALRARLMKAVFGVRPFCFVEGWGPDAAKAPFVEEFHDWQVRKSELPLELARTIHGALIEDAYVLEVSEKIETRRITETIDAALEVNDAGGAMFADGKPVFKRDADGELVPAKEGEPAATVERVYTKTKRLGPQYDAISMKDFVFLPGHAKGRKNVWGYAYRCFQRVPELQEKADDGIYDKDAVKLLGDSSDRSEAALPVTVSDAGRQEGPSVEKELFQVSLKRDLDGDGREEWYLATVSLKFRTMLRLKLDTFVQKVGRPRCVPFVLFPRRNSVYGYSYAYDKLLTLAEEHTALRNMKADRSALATNSPIQQVQGGLWDPDAQPIGIGRIITVRDQNELIPMTFPDVPNSVVEQEHSLHNAKERVGGLSDASVIGVTSAERRTATEQRIVASGSGVRVDEVIGHVHAAIADVMLLTHAIWQETLKADPKGIDAPQSVAQSLASRGAELTDGKFTAAQLSGDFQFEPYGSDETADPQKQRDDFNGGLQALAGLAKVFPGLLPVLQSPVAAKAILEQWLRKYNVKDRQPFLGAMNQAPPMPPSVGPGMSPGPAGPPAGAPGEASGMPPELMALLSQMGGPAAPGIQ